MNRRQELKSEVFLSDRTKNTQKHIIQTIGTINLAMARKWDGRAHTPQKISFKYMTYRINDIHNQVKRRKGSNYTVSPHKLLINDGNYYLLAFDSDKNDFRTYRIDRMTELNLVDEPREGQEIFSKIDLSSYTRRVFSMYGGHTERVTMQFINPLLDTVIERFGTGSDVFYMPTEDKRHFKVVADVEVSNQFFGWICGFGKRVVITSPQNVVDEFKNFINNIKSIYEVE